MTQPLVGVVCAMASEAASLLAPVPPLLKFNFTPHFVYCISGIGATRATAGAQKLVAAGAKILISFGVCGALAPTLRAGDIVIAERVITQHKTFTGDAEIAQRLRYALPHPLAGALLHTDAPLATPADKHAAYSGSGALAVDMESAAVAAVAAENQLPFVAARVVVDAVDRSVPRAAINGVDELGQLRAWALLRELCAAPASGWQLLQLGRDFQRAQHGLRQVAQAIRGLSAVTA